MKEKFNQLLEANKTDEMISFLKHLSQEERRKLVPEIKKQDKIVNKFVQKGNSYSIAGTRGQQRMVMQASFVCMNKKEFGRKYWQLPLEILSWYCPVWFSDFVNESAEGEFSPFTYDKVMEWERKGFVTPSPELLGRTLVSYEIKHLDKYPETIREHLWYMLEFFPNNLSFRPEWISTLVRLVDENKLDRFRLLQQCLYACNKDYNKNGVAWYMDLFVALNPQKEELLALQDELFLGLASIHSKAINTSLKYIQTIITEKEFKLEEFLIQCSLTLASEVKAVVKGSQTILELCLKNKIGKPQNICLLLAEAFIHSDESIQKKSANLLAKYGIAETEIKQKLAMYNSSILMSIRPILLNFLEEEAEDLVDKLEIDISAKTLIRSENEIPEVNTFEDYIYFLLEALDVGEMYYFDKSLQLLVRYKNEINETNISYFEPILQRAFKKLNNWGMSFGERILNNLIFHYGKQLIAKYPTELVAIHKLYLELEDKSNDKYRYTRVFYQNPDKLDYPGGLKCYKELVLATYGLLLEDSIAPEPLSTPTHQPIWIKPEILVERIASYQETGALPLDLDMQLALHRCALDETEEALKLAKEKLKGEYLYLMEFLLDKDRKAEGSFEHPNWWLTAGVIKQPNNTFAEFEEIGNKFYQLPNKFFAGKHDWKIEVDNTKYWPVKLVCKSMFPSQVIRDSTLLVDDLSRNQTAASEIEAAINCVPSLPHIVLAHVIAQCMAYSAIYEVTEKRVVTIAIQSLLNLDVEYSETTHLFLSLAMLNANKTIRNYAAEVWIQGTASEKINNKLLGQQLGVIEKDEWGPLKRFTDLVTTNILGITAEHNVALQVMLETMICEFNNPITNLKKLLEIYNELLLVNKSLPSEDVKLKLKSWQNTGLKKTVKQLLDREE